MIAHQVFLFVFINIIFFVQSAPSKLNGFSKNDLGKQSFGSSSKLIDSLLKNVNKRETPVEIHDNSNEPTESLKSSVLADIEMDPDELTELARKRRMILSNDRLQRRNKRSLSTYDLYDINPLHQSYARPTRAFTPIYWYIPSYSRHIRSVLEPSFYQPSEWNRIYPETLESADNDNDQIPFFTLEDDDGYNRYPILFDSSSDIPYDNLQLQQEYNNPEWPIDDNDDNNGEVFLSYYDPFDSYHK